MVPTVYQKVLDSVPGMHARPPDIPKVEDPETELPPRPKDGYAFIMHCGVATPRPLRLETQAHKCGYPSLDAEGNLCPLVPGLDGEVRGFGPGYEKWPDVLKTSLDVEKMKVHLDSSGIVVRCLSWLPSMVSRSPLAQGLVGVSRRWPLPLRLHLLLLASTSVGCAREVRPQQANTSVFHAPTADQSADVYRGGHRGHQEDCRMGWRATLSVSGRDTVRKESKSVIVLSLSHSVLELLQVSDQRVDLWAISLAVDEGIPDADEKP